MNTFKHLNNKDIDKLLFLISPFPNMWHSSLLFAYCIFVCVCVHLFLFCFIIIPECSKEKIKESKTIFEDFLKGRSLGTWILIENECSLDCVVRCEMLYYELNIT